MLEFDQGFADGDAAGLVFIRQLGLVQAVAGRKFTGKNPDTIWRRLAFSGLPARWHLNHWTYRLPGFLLLHNIAGLGSLGQMGRSLAPNPIINSTRCGQGTEAGLQTVSARRAY